MSAGGFPDDTATLDKWASANVTGYRGPSRVRKFDTGQSNPTYLVETPGERYVLRRKPPASC